MSDGLHGADRFATYENILTEPGGCPEPKLRCIRGGTTDRGVLPIKMGCYRSICVPGVTPS